MNYHKFSFALILSVMILWYSCTPYQPRQKDFLSQNVDYLIVKGNEYWDKRAEPKNAVWAKNFLFKAHQFRPQDQETCLMYSRACFFEGKYIEQDKLKRDTLFIEGALTALSVVLNIDPKEINPELTTSEPYVMGSHATCSGAWASGPEDYAPDEYQWGYNRMMTVEGLFGAGDTIGGTAHKFSSGSFTEGRIAGKAAIKYVNDLGSEAPQVSESEYEQLKQVVFQPLETYEVGRNEIVAGTVSPSYCLLYTSDAADE